MKKILIIKILLLLSLLFNLNSSFASTSVVTLPNLNLGTITPYGVVTSTGTTTVTLTRVLSAAYGSTMQNAINMCTSSSIGGNTWSVSSEYGNLRNNMRYNHTSFLPVLNSLFGSTEGAFAFISGQYWSNYYLYNDYNYSAGAWMTYSSTYLSTSTFYTIGNGPYGTFFCEANFPFQLNSSPTISGISNSTINGNNVSNVGFTISGVTDTDSGQILTYKYQVNGGIWNDVGTGSTPKSSFDYSFNLNTTSWPEGNNTISFKINDGMSDSNILTKNITKDTIAPILSSGSISSLTNDSTPNFDFFTTEPGNIIYSGSCNSNYSIGYFGFNTIELNALMDGNYSNCKIGIIDTAGNVSQYLNIGNFTIDTIPPGIVTNVLINNGNQFTNNKILNLEVTHPNESDIDGWCTTEDTYNECNWLNSKPNTYQLQD